MIKPFSYQVGPIDSIRNALERGNSILDASDTGVGKTVHTLLAAKHLGIRLGVVCPKSVIPAWRDLAAEIGVETLFITNVESLKAQKKWVQRYGNWWHWSLPRNVTLVFDEVHRFAASNTQNGKILASAPKPVIMLSATAAMDPTKMRAIGSQLDLTTWNNWWHWCGQNGCKKGYWGGIEFRGGKEHLDRLHRQIFKTGRGVRVRIRDLGDAFPQNRLETVLVPVEDQESVDEAYTEELRVLGASADPLEAQLRARQISEHQKIPAMVDLTHDLLDSGNTVLIFVNFRDTLERLEHELDFKFPTIYGESSEEDRNQIVESLKRDEWRGVICMIQAGGVGLGFPDLRGEHPRVSLICPGFNPVDIRQAAGRGCRATSVTPSIVKFLFADGTMEMPMKRKVDKKLGNIDLLNDGDLRP